MKCQNVILWFEILHVDTLELIPSKHDESYGDAYIYVYTCIYIYLPCVDAVCIRFEFNVPLNFAPFYLIL